jgi:hypothetical protein
MRPSQEEKQAFIEEWVAAAPIYDIHAHHSVEVVLAE